MSTTPTREDHDAAKRLVDSIHLDAHPWTLEHIAAAIADARAEGRAEGASTALRDARERADILRRAATR